MIIALLCLKPVALMAISKLTNLNERSIFTGTTMGIAMVVGLGLTPVVLGAVADAWNFQIGIGVLGVLTTLSCVSLRGLQEIESFRGSCSLC